MKQRQYEATHSAMLSANVRAIRKARNLSVKGLADGLTEQGFPISPTVIQKIDAGTKATVNIDEAFALARFLDMPIEQLATTPACETCHGSPPPNFTCNTCGADLTTG